MLSRFGKIIADDRAIVLLLNSNMIGSRCLFILLLIVMPLVGVRAQFLSTDATSAPNTYDFKNINQQPYYYNKKQLKEISKFEKSKEWEKHYQALKVYVSNFGIENFYKDTYLLWRLAKLSELLGHLEEAKELYKIVLKHHRKESDLRKIELHYDSLAVNDKDYYVPLEYYYELISYRQEVDTLRPPRGLKINMGTEINSTSSDYGPTLNVHDNVLFFTSKRNFRRINFDKMDNEDIFFSQRVEGFWSDAKELKEINTRFNEGSAALSKDGKTLYFARCDSPDGLGNCDIYSAKMQADSTWGEIKNLGTEVNSTSWDSHPSLSHSEDTLFFASDRLGGFGLSDIWFTYKSGKDGKWAKAVNLGPTINTRQNELSPFLHPRFNILYFSSNGHLLNFGEFDIYKSRMVKNFWQEPKNIGPLVNGAGSEYYFTIDANAKDLFYAHSKDSNLDNLDLFSFPLPMEAKPNAYANLSGIVVDSISGKPVSGIVSIIDLDHGVEVAPKFLRPDGSFEFDLINNNNYLLIIQSDEFFRIEEMFYLDGDTEIRRSAQPITSRLQFSKIEFENGKAALRPEMFEDLDKIVNFLLDNPDFKLKISGHTDSDGREEFNLELSQQRANSIKEYITFFGNVNENRVEAIGFGSSKPIVEENTAADKAMNRRVEFEIYRRAEGEVFEEPGSDW